MVAEASQEKKEEDDEDEKFPYKPMEREFYTGRWWLWLIQAIAYVVIAYFYFAIQGKELTYAIYIPLDFALFLSKLAFYIYYYNQDLRKKRLEGKL